jgi:hypothetical protein
MSVSNPQNPPTGSRQFAQQPYETVREMSAGKSPLLLAIPQQQIKSESDTKKQFFF